MMKKILFLFLLAVALNACVDPDNIRVLKVERIGMQGLSRLDATLRVENRGRRVSIEEGKLNLMRGTVSAIDVVLGERVEVPRGTTADIPVTLRLKVANPLVMIGIAQNPAAALNGMTVSGELTFKAGMRKKIRFDSVPFPEFLRILGVDTDKVTETLKL